MPNKKENMSHEQKVADQDLWWQRGSMNPLGYLNMYDDATTRLTAVADGMDTISKAPIPVVSQIAGGIGGAARTTAGVIEGDNKMIGEGIMNLGFASIPGGKNIQTAADATQFTGKHVTKKLANKSLQLATQQDGGEQLPNVIINEDSPQLYDHMDNTIYVHPEDVEGPQVPYKSEHEPDHVLRHELEHYYQWQDLKDEEWPNMAPTAGEYDIMTDSTWYPPRQDNPMSQRLEDDREMVMKDMYLRILDPDGTNFWLQNMNIEDLMDELALDNEAIYQLERQVMNQPIHVRDYMLERIRGERAERLYLQSTEEVYYDPRTLEGQARMIEDDGRYDAHVIETLKNQAIENREEGISDHPYIKKEMKTLQKDK